MTTPYDLTAIFAKNLKTVMGEKWSQSSLSRASGVPQTTIGLYMSPARRGGPTPKGRMPGPTMMHLVDLAVALEVQPWELLHPDLERARREQEMYAKIEADFVIKKTSAPAESDRKPAKGRRSA